MKQLSQMELAAKYAELGKIELAIATYLPLVDASNPEAMTALAILYLENRIRASNGEEDAEALLRRAISLGYSPAASAMVLLATRDKRKAVDDPPRLGEPQDTEKSNSESEMQSLLTKARSGDIQSLKRAAKKFQEEPEELATSFDPLIKILYGSIEAGETSLYRHLGFLLLVRKERRTAEKCFSHAIFYGDQEISKQLVTFYRRPRENILSHLQKVADNRSVASILELAEVFREHQIFDAAEFWYLRAIDLGYSDGAILLSNLYRRELHDLGKFKSLASELEKSSPYHAHLIRADALLDNRSFRDAVTLYEQALAVNPTATAPIIGIHLSFKKAKTSEGFKNWLLADNNGKYLANVRAIALRYSNQRNVSKGAEWQSFANLMEPQRDTSAIYKEQIEQPEARSEYEPNHNDSIDSELFETWLLEGHQQISATYIAKNSQFLKSLFNLGFEFCPLVGNWMGYRANEDWLDEILAKYEDQSSFQDLDPAWPIRFQSEELQIVLSIEGNWLRAFVGKRNMGGLLAIRLNNFEISSALSDDDRNFAVGIAVSFFLDRTISLDDNGHPHFDISSPGLITGTQDFTTNIQNLRRGTRKPMEPHKVSGFIRNLPPGHKPSDEATARAPIYIRRNLKPNQTFVRDHQRNGPVVKDAIIRYLKRNSNLADAFGSLSE